MIRYRRLLALPNERPPSIKALHELKKAVGRDLPEAYIRLVSAVEDFAVPYSVFLDGRPYSYGLENVEWSTRYLEGCAWFRDQLPEVMLPIGRTGGEDDTLLLDLTDAHYGRVLAWVSGRPGWPGKPEDDLLHTVAPDLDTYLDNLVLFARDLDDEEDDPAMAAWVAEQAPPQPLVVGGTDWGPGWRLGDAKRG